MSSTPESPTVEEQPEPAWSAQRVILLSAGALGGIIVVIFLIGLALALLSSLEATAARLDILKNTLVIIMVLELMVIVFALAVLALQVTRLINLLQNKSKPILESAHEAVQSAKGTVEFVGDTVTEPIVRVGSFVAGTRVLIREVGGIRRAIQHNEDGENDSDQLTEPK